MDTVSVARAHGGIQHVVKHRSESTGTAMTFSVFVPPQAEDGQPCPVVFYQSGLTCTHANVTEKGFLCRRNAGDSCPAISTAAPTFGG